MRFLTGFLSVSAKEWRGTLLSPRLLIIALILALAVLAGSYAITAGPGGGGETPTEVLYAFQYYPDLMSNHPALAAFVASPTGEPLAGVKIQLLNLTSREGPTVLQTVPTDQSGWARFEELWNYPGNQFSVRLESEQFGRQAFASVSSGSGTQVNVTGIVSTGELYLQRSSGPVLSLVFANITGTPVDGADVYLWRYANHSDLIPGPPPEEPQDGWDQHKIGITDTNGFYIRSEPLDAGQYIILVRKGSLNSTQTASFFGPIGQDFLSSPDGPLAFAGIIFLPLILPILALALSYDAIAREKAEGSLDLLLSKPVSRLGVALGKLAGAFGSMMIPVVGVLLAAAGLIWVRLGEAPTGSFVAGLIGAALVLLLIYSLIFLAVSALARTLGMALLFSVVLFLVFAFFWGLVSFLVANLAGPVGSVQWFQVNVAMSLGSPSGVYQQLLTRSFSFLSGGFFVVSSGPGAGIAQNIGLEWVALAAVAWTVVPLLLFLWTMKYRVTEA